MLREILLSSLIALTLAQHLPSLNRNRFPVLTLPCTRKCQFRFCADRTKVQVTALEFLSGSAICRQLENIDQVLRTGEALVSLESGNVPISEWRPDGLDPPFSPDIFGVTPVLGEQNSFIKVSNLQGNQNDYLARRCLILPVKKYEQVKVKNGRRRVRSRLGGRPDRACIAFEPSTSGVIFQARWFSGDDLDISIEEPDGTLLDFKDRHSKCGILNDGGLNGCELSQFNNEWAAYSKDCEGFQRGTYTILLRHTSNCRLTGPPEVTRYEIHVAVDGINRVTITGSSGKGNGELITSFRTRI